MVTIAERLQVSHHRYGAFGRDAPAKRAWRCRKPAMSAKRNLFHAASPVRDLCVAGSFRLDRDRVHARYYVASIPEHLRLGLATNASRAELDDQSSLTVAGIADVRGHLFVGGRVQFERLRTAEVFRAVL